MARRLSSRSPGKHLRGAEGLAGADGRHADGPAAADQHGLALHLRGLHAVDARAHGLEHAGGFIGDIVRQQERAVGADGGILGKGAVLRTAEQLDVLADVGHPVGAEIAAAAGDVALAGDAVAHLAVGDVLTHGHDVAGRLMSQRHRRLDAFFRPLVPVEDMDIRTADGGAVYLDEDFIVLDLRDGQIIVVDQTAGSGHGLDQSAHNTFHSRPPFSSWCGSHDPWRSVQPHG